MAGFFESDEGSPLYTSVNTQILTVDLFKEILESFISALVERMEGFFKKDFTQIKDTSEDTASVFQLPNNSELLNKEAEETIQFNVPLENEMC